MARKTLAEYNADGVEVEHGDTTEIRERAVGKQGRRQTGDKVHMLTAYRIVAVRGDRQHRHVGAFSVITARCNGNGQFTGTVLKGFDTDAINCERCIKSCHLEG